MESNPADQHTTHLAASSSPPDYWPWNGADGIWPDQSALALPEYGIAPSGSTYDPPRRFQLSAKLLAVERRERDLACSISTRPADVG